MDEQGRQLDTVRETEVKLTVPPDADLGALLDAGGTVSAVEEPTTAVLSSTYFDTADLRLAREGITLRERVGDDEGWHLKVPAGTEGRHEIRAELGGDQPPAELLDLVTVHTRGDPVAPVATLETTRVTRRLLGSDRKLLGVVVDDAVRVLSGDTERSSFREIEVEAHPEVADPAELLTEVTGRLVDAGATLGEQMSKAVRALGPAAQQPPTPPPASPLSDADSAAAAVTAHLRNQARALMKHDMGVRRNLPDAVHQMRVSARRFRSTLRTFRPLLDRPDDLAELSDELAWAADVLGEVRDREVLLARLERDTAELPLPKKERAALADQVAKRLGAEMTTARAAVLDMLAGDRYRRLVDCLVAVATEPPLTTAADAPATEVVPALVEAAAEDLRKRAGRLNAESPDTAYHRARIAAKRARYAGELAAPVFRPAKAYAQAAEAVQEVLGEHQDAAVAAETARRLADGASAEVAFGLGMLAGYERASAAAARAEIPGRWRDMNAVSLSL